MSPARVCKRFDCMYLYVCLPSVSTFIFPFTSHKWSTSRQQVHEGRERERTKQRLWGQVNMCVKETVGVKKKGGGGTKSVPKFISSPFTSFILCILKIG